MSSPAIDPAAPARRRVPSPADGPPRPPGLPAPAPGTGLWRRLPPAYSPVAGRAVRRAARLALARPYDPRPEAAEIIRGVYRADAALLVGSGTQALQLAIGAAAGPLVDEPVVALPAFGCYDVATAAVGAGARIALYDLDPATLAPDLDSLATVLREGARIVVAAPLYGIPLDWEVLETCAAGFGATVIEDAAQGHGAAWRQRPLGSLGRYSVLSFGRGKGCTGGSGGALLVRDVAVPVVPATEPGISAELRVLVVSAAQWALGDPSRYALPASMPWLGLGATRYRDPQRPAPMTRAAAALVSNTWALAAREAVLRRANAEWLLERLQPGAAVRPVRPPAGSTPGYLRLPLRLSRGLAGFRDGSRALRLGVMPSYPGTLAALRAVQARLAGSASRWPGAEALVRELVTLPTHSLASAGERAALVGLCAGYVG